MAYSIINAKELDFALEERGFRGSYKSLKKLEDLRDTDMPSEEVETRIKTGKQILASNPNIDAMEQYRSLLVIEAVEELPFEILDTYPRGEQRVNRYKKCYRKVIGRRATPKDLYGEMPLRPDPKIVAYYQKHGGTKESLIELQSGSFEHVVLFHSLAETLEMLNLERENHLKSHGWEK